MKKIVRIKSSAIIIALIVAFWSCSSAASDTKLQSLPIILKSKNVLEKDLLQGENYTINPTVMNDGLINTYHLTTDYGSFEMESTAGLMNRINELNALRKMEALEQSGVFKDSLVEGIKAPIKGAVDLIKSPIETTKGFLSGTGKFLSNMGHAIVSDDPNQDNVLKVAIGYDAAKRAYAYEFGINPYSSYEPLINRLGQIARSAVAGGLVPRATLSVIDEDFATVMSISAFTKNIRKLLRDNSPSDLHKINKEKLEKLGIASPMTEAFLSNYSYDPQERTLLVAALEQMHGVQGLEIFISAADTSTNRSVAFLYRLIAEMMAGYHTKVAPVERIAGTGSTLFLQKKDGTLVLTLPMDFVFKTKKIAAKLDSFNKGIQVPDKVTGKELWIAGKIDREALTMFETDGWKVTENANSILMKE
jgi:hypothetical protein